MKRRPPRRQKERYLEAATKQPAAPSSSNSRQELASNVKPPDELPLAEAPGPKPFSPTVGPKTVFFLRNAETEFDVAVTATGTDPLDWDSPLAATGRRFAASSAQRACRRAILVADVILVSPSWSALETCEIALLHALTYGVPVIVHPLLREKCNSSACLGSPLHILEARFPKFDFSNCRKSPVWWYTGEPGGAEKKADHVTGGNLLLEVESAKRTLEMCPASMGLLCEYDQEVCIACRGKRSKANKGKQQSAHELLTTLEEFESISGRKRFQETSGGFSEPEEDFRARTKALHTLLLGASSPTIFLTFLIS